ncbi:MAG: MBL fold metallo-hydrolase [Cyclobacteriaceae bacterium]|nr:MBL fold metallo-hydrolase [Cyclobacteriaceae bacterium]
MIVTFLGTGTSQGVPVIACDCPVCSSLDYKDKRLRSSIHINVNETSIVVDTGPDFRQQMLRENINKLDAVLYTHAHKDHTAGMDDIRSFNFMQNMDMPIYARNSVIEQLKQEFSYVFETVKYPGVPRVEINILDGQPFKISEVEITPIETLHYKLPVFGFRINNFAYITDTNYISDGEKKKLKGLEVLVLNTLQKEKHISHFNLEEALELIRELQPSQTYLIHMSHKIGKHSDIQASLPNHVYLAFDGLKIEM